MTNLTNQIMTEAQIKLARDIAITHIKIQCKTWVIVASLMICFAHWLGWHNILITGELPIDQHGLTIGFTSFAIISLSFVLSGVGLLISLALIEKKNNILLRFENVDIGLLGINEMTKPLSEFENAQFNELAKSSVLAERILSASQAEKRYIRKFELEAVRQH